MKKLLITASLIVMLGAGAAFAAPSKDQLAREFITASRVDAALLSVMPDLTDQISASLFATFQQMMSEPLTEKDKKELRTIIEKEFSSSEIIDMIVPFYSEYFTESELKELVAFYKTPVGKKAAQSQTDLLPKIKGAAEKWGMQKGVKIMLDGMQYLQKAHPNAKFRGPQ